MTGATLDRLQPLKNLRMLVLSDNAISDAGLRELRNLPGIVELNLAGMQITGQGLACLAPLVKLRRLNLDRTTVGDDDLSRLPNRGSLVALWLYGTRVSDHGLKHLRECANLRDLSLNGPGTRISDSGLAELEDIPRCECSTSMAPVSPPPESRRLKAKLPRCNVGLDKHVQDELDQLLGKP